MDHAEPSRKRPGKSRRIALALSAAPLSALTLWLYPTHILPVLNEHARQDDCRFPGVSEARYDRFASVARSKVLSGSQMRPPWASGPRERTPGSNAFVERFASVVSEADSVGERIAAMHAFMRANKAIYVDTTVEFRTAPPGWRLFGSPPSPENISQKYEQYDYRYWNWASFPLGCLIRCSEDITIYFQIADRPARHYSSHASVIWKGRSIRQGEFVAQLSRWPNIQDGAVGELRVNKHAVCPEAPSIEWVSELSGAVKEGEER